MKKAVAAVSATHARTATRRWGRAIDRTSFRAPTMKKTAPNRAVLPPIDSVKNLRGFSKHSVDSAMQNAPNPIQMKNPIRRCVKETLENKEIREE